MITDKLIDTINLMEPQHLEGLRRLYCSPHLSDIGDVETRQELANFGIYLPDPGVGRRTMTHFGFQIANHLLSIGQFPKEVKV